MVGFSRPNIGEVPMATPKNSSKPPPLKPASSKRAGEKKESAPKAAKTQPSSTQKAIPEVPPKPSGMKKRKERDVALTVLDRPRPVLAPIKRTRVRRTKKIKTGL